MGQLLKTELTREELKNGWIPSNYVMVESELTAEGKTTKGGIVVGHDEDVTFYSSEENADHAHEADIAQICSRVYEVPDKLYYNKEDQVGSMPWDCDMELQVGDMVWYSVLESRNAVTVVCEGRGYKLIPIQDCYVAKKEDEVICLNGYVLLEPVYHKNDSPLAVSQKGEVDKTRGIVRYVGNPNREYLVPYYADFQNLEIGDEVLLAQGTSPWLLERKSYLAQFDKENLYWVVQRRRISLVLSKNN